MDHFLSVKEAVNKYIAGCEAKIHTPTGHLFVKAVLAGMMIALGASGSSVAAHAIGNIGIARMAAATVFPVGLMMVILMGAELFTGDCLMVMAIADNRYAVKQLIKVLSIVYIGNFVGAILIASGVGYSSQLNYSDGLLGAYTIKVALAKVNMSFGEAMISGILCNILVCFAVMMALCAKDITGKLSASFFGIFLFVTEGFEHCVANMYYISAGLVAACNPQYVQVAIEQYGLNIEQLANLDIPHFLMGNLIPVTIGNIIGGMLLVGIPLLYLNKEKTGKKQCVKEENNEYSMVFERSIPGISN